MASKGTGKNKSGRESRDPTWDHCTRIGTENRMHLRCNYCLKEGWGGVIRMKHHLAGTHGNIGPCPQVSEDVRNFFVQYLTNLGQQAHGKQTKSVSVDELEALHDKDLTSKSRGSMEAYVTKGKGKQVQQTMNQMIKKREPVIRDIYRCIYGNALSFNLVKSPLFQKMLTSVGEYGKGLKLPSYHEVRVSYLKKKVDYVKQDLEIFKKEWKKTGCTLMSGGWSDGKSRHLIKFLVNSPSGTVFVKSIDASGIIQDSKTLFEMLDAMVEEIGEEHVVQVVIDGASAYVKAGEMLEAKRKTLIWSPCAAHCLNNMLSDLGELPVFKSTLEKAREMTLMIYRHAWVLDLFRYFTNQKELTRPAVTRFSTSYLTLKRILELKLKLRAMFASEEWATSSHGRSVQGQKVTAIVLNDETFWKGVTFCTKLTLPLVKVLRLVDGDAKPPMGYIYEAMDRAKEAIASSFDNKIKRYEKIWKIIDARWDLQLHRPLHAVGYYLNPKFCYAENFKADSEVKRGFYLVAERMFLDIEARIAINEQVHKFLKAEGMFSLSMAKLARDKQHPALWWEGFGSECPELQSLAIKVLSLTCSSSGCERNWSTFDHIHLKKRNRLEAQRLEALVFVKYNIQLQMRQEKRQQMGDTYDPISLSDMDSDDEWITEREDPCLPIDHSWMDVQECFQEEEGVSNKRKRGPRDLRADRKGKGKQIELEDDENEGIGEEYGMEKELLEQELQDLRDAGYTDEEMNEIREEQLTKDDENDDDLDLGDDED